MVLVVRLDRTDPADHLRPGEAPGRPFRLVSADGVTTGRLYAWPEDKEPGCYVLPELGLEIHHGATCPTLLRAGAS